MKNRALDRFSEPLPKLTEFWKRLNYKQLEKTITEKIKQ
jgi:hypothetical protein